MTEIQLPQNIEIKEKGNNTATVIIEPLYPGYGLTLGNALRRVLISSIPGAAVTALKIKGVQHEFSSLPHVKEDIVEIILNIKLLHLKLLQGESATMTLKVKGEKKVTAKDIKTPSEVEIVNQDLKIATLTDQSAELEIEFTVKRGLGYSPVEGREKENSEIGLIAIDAIFTPVLKARFEIENVRVGQMTNFDKLTLELETDGIITPAEAFQQAAKLLLDHFSLLHKTKETKAAAPRAKKTKTETKRVTKSKTDQEAQEKDNKEQKKTVIDEEQETSEDEKK